MPDANLLTPDQAGAALGISGRQVRRLIADGVLPARQLGPRTILIRRADLAKAKRRPGPGNPNFGAKGR